MRRSLAILTVLCLTVSGARAVTSTPATGSSVSTFTLAPKAAPASKAKTSAIEKNRKKKIGQPADAQPVKTVHFNVHANRLKLARRIANRAEAELQRVCENLTINESILASRVDIFIWPNRRQYLTYAPDAPPHSTGCTTEQITPEGYRIHRIDLLRNERQDATLGELLKRILPHEICHIMLREYFAAQPVAPPKTKKTGKSGDATTPRCPLALHEGLAMLAERGVDNFRVELAAAAIAAKQDTPLPKLLGHDTYNQVSSLALFYAESYSFAEFLRGKLSDEQFSDFLAELRRGSKMDVAISRAMALPHEKDFLLKLSKAWKKYAALQGKILRSLKKSETKPKTATKNSNTAAVTKTPPAQRS
ncbi:MAG: hypothetical protein K8S55_07695 [Phycisphaerae bacterium]|nr:hypothetical protein [Phycisphaerae bacterium]